MPFTFRFELGQAEQTREFFIFYLSVASGTLLPKRVVSDEELARLGQALVTWVGERARLES